MSLRYWLRRAASGRVLAYGFFTVGAVCGIAVFIWAFWPPEPPLARHGVVAEWEYIAQNLDSECLTISSGTPLAEPEPQQAEACSQKAAAQRKNYADLTQSIRSANAAEHATYLSYLQTRIAIIGAIVVFATLALTAIATFAAGRAAQAAVDAAESGRDAVLIGNRPWLSVDIAMINALYADKQGDVRGLFKFAVKNHGKSPAINVDIEAELHTIFGDERPLQKAVAERIRARSPNPTDSGFTLFPGQTEERLYNLVIGRPELEAFHRRFAAIGGEANDESAPIGRPIFPVLIGAVGYKFPFTPGVRQTGFMLKLSRPNGFVVKIEELPVPAKELTLSNIFMSVPPE